MQVAERSNWAEGPGLGRELRAPWGRLSLCWSPKIWGLVWKKRRSWELQLRGLNLWTAVGECS